MGHQINATAPDLALPMIRIAENQPEFVPITVAVAHHDGYAPGPNGYNTVIMAFKPTDEQRKAIADGADVYVSLLTFGRAQQGIIVMAGKQEAEAIFSSSIHRHAQSGHLMRLVCINNAEKREDHSCMVCS